MNYEQFVEEGERNFMYLAFDDDERGFLCGVIMKAQDIIDADLFLAIHDIR